MGASDNEFMQVQEAEAYRQNKYNGIDMELQHLRFDLANIKKHGADKIEILAYANNGLRHIDSIAQKVKGE